MKLFFVILLILFYGFVSCRNEPKIRYLQHDLSFGDSIIAQVNPQGLSETPINLCEIFNYGWDSMIVIPPYSQLHHIKKIALDNFSTVSSDLKNSNQDQYTTLLFIKNNKVFKQERVYNTPVGFSLLEDPINIIPVVKSGDCDRMVLRRVITTTISKKNEYALLYK